MRKVWQYGLVPVVIGSAIAAGGAATPAQAAGRFSYGADVQNYVNSRSWHANNGHIMIQAACEGQVNHKYQIYLYPEDDYYAKTAYTYTCTGKIQSRTWTPTRAGYYHFRIVNDGTTKLHVSGNVFYS